MDKIVIASPISCRKLIRLTESMIFPKGPSCFDSFHLDVFDLFTSDSHFSGKLRNRFPASAACVRKVHIICGGSIRRLLFSHVPWGFHLLRGFYYVDHIPISKHNSVSHVKNI